MDKLRAETLTKEVSVNAIDFKSEDKEVRYSWLNWMQAQIVSGTESEWALNLLTMRSNNFNHK